MPHINIYSLSPLSLSLSVYACVFVLFCLVFALFYFFSLFVGRVFSVSCVSFRFLYPPWPASFPIVIFLPHFILRYLRISQTLTIFRIAFLLCCRFHFIYVQMFISSFSSLFLFLSFSFIVFPVYSLFPVWYLLTYLIFFSNIYS